MVTQLFITTRTWLEAVRLQADFCFNGIKATTPVVCAAKQLVSILFEVEVGCLCVAFLFVGSEVVSGPFTDTMLHKRPQRASY